MRSQWSEEEAGKVIARYASTTSEDVARCLYASHLLGADRRLVLHGGGNISVKTRRRDVFGDEIEVLCIKGSGADMARLEPAGLPAVRLDPLRRLHDRPKLDDDEMVRILRAGLLDPAAPNPSVETLLHAFLPHKYVVHTHATAVLSLTNQPDGQARCDDLYQRRLGIVPYIMPGFGLAKVASQIFEATRHVEGLVLCKHGIVTFGETAEQAYERMVSAVTLAEERLKQARKTFVPSAILPAATVAPEDVAPILRGACAIQVKDLPGAFRHFILDFRNGSAVMNFVNGAEVERYARAGVATPDHAIRTKAWPLILRLPSGNPEDIAKATRDAVAQFGSDYVAYAARHGSADEIDAGPRVILIPGLGLFGLGRSAQDAKIAADLAKSWVDAVTDAEAVGRFESISETETFAIEHWSLEQAKLEPPSTKPLAGQVAVVTGGAGTIGMATAKAFRAAGAEVVIFDLDTKQVDQKDQDFDGVRVDCDVTKSDSVAAGFRHVVARFGGVDIVVSNAGAIRSGDVKWTGRIGEVSQEIMHASFELNFFSHQLVAQNAVKIMLAQDTGGCLLFNVSRQAVSPGPDFGAYGMPKAATLALMRQYALEYGHLSIRSNAVNADGIRGGLLDEETIKLRSASYRMTVQEYMGRNLLKHEVLAPDVAQAFVDLALGRSTTGSFATVDGGNIGAAPR